MECLLLRLRPPRGWLHLATTTWVAAPAGEPARISVVWCRPDRPGQAKNEQVW